MAASAESVELLIKNMFGDFGGGAHHASNSVLQARMVGSLGGHWEDTNAQ